MISLAIEVQKAALTSDESDSDRRQ